MISLKKLFGVIPDKLAIQILFYYHMKKRLNLDNPQTMNEKLQWLKLYNRNELYRTLVDKIAVKKYITDNIGEQYIAPLLGVWDKFDDIDFSSLPDQFVLKTNNGSGNHGVIVVSDKNNFDKDKARRALEKSLQSNVYSVYREWPYKDMDAKIFGEAYLGKDLIDYKFYCFNGVADSVMVCIERNTGSPKFYFFDKDWKLCRYNKRGKEAPADFTLPKPSCIDEMFKLAEKLSTGMPFVRMDFYEVEGKIYFGEFTFFPLSGLDKNRLPEADQYFGSKIKLN